MRPRLSVPSYVIPGTYLENLRFLEERTDCRAVELLFFMYDDETAALLAAERAGLRDYASRFAYTVHLPDEIAPAHEEILEATADYAEGYVVHPPRRAQALPAFVGLLNAWRARYGEQRLRLENTRLTAFEAAEAALRDSSLGPPCLCADLGHLLMEGVEPSAWVAARAERVRELHVHGYDGRSDHVPFGPEEAWLAALAPFARGFQGPIEVELFSWAEQDVARAILRDAWGLPC